MFLAERFHWTLDEVDNLSWEDLLGIYATLEGKEKALDAMHRKP